MIKKTIQGIFNIHNRLVSKKEMLVVSVPAILIFDMMFLMGMYGSFKADNPMIVIPATMYVGLALWINGSLIYDIMNYRKK